MGKRIELSDGSTWERVEFAPLAGQAAPLFRWVRHFERGPGTPLMMPFHGCGEFTALDHRKIADVLDPPAAPPEPWTCAPDCISPSQCAMIHAEGKSYVCGNCERHNAAPPTTGEDALQAIFPEGERRVIPPMHDGWCVECGDEFRLDDCGGYNPPCPCGCGRCPECCRAEKMCDEEYADAWGDSPEGERK